MSISASFYFMSVGFIASLWILWFTTEWDPAHVYLLLGWAITQTLAVGFWIRDVVSERSKP